MYKAFFLLLIAMFIFVGCEDDDNPTSPQETTYSVNVTGLPDSLTAPEDVMREILFMVTVVNNRQQAVAGVNVDLTVSAGSGTITPSQAATDANGIIEAVYSVEMPSGRTIANVTIVIDEKVIHRTIQLIGTSRPYQVSLIADPSTITVYPGEDAVIQLTALVVDSNRVGVPYTNVRFTMISAEENGEVFGGLTPSFQTDANGNAEATFHSSGGFGVLIIRCEINEGDDLSGIYDEQTIEIVSGVPGSTQLYLYANCDYIYADNGVTSATLSAVLRSEDNQAIPDQEIIFSANNFGTVQSPKLTDSLGIATVTFRDFGLESRDVDGERAPCMIIAKYDPMGLSDTVYIDIRPLEWVDNIVLRAGKQTMGVESNESTWIRAFVYLDEERTHPAPRGTIVNFDVTMGMGSFIQDHVTVGSGGVAETHYVAGNRLGVATLTASVINQGAAEDGGDTTITSNEVQIELVPGPPYIITMQVNPIVLYIGEPGEQSTITVTVMDSVGNPIRDNTALVQFSTTLGTVTPPSATTVDGIARAILRPGVVAGRTTIIASVDGPSGPISAQASVRFISGDGTTIELSAFPLQIRVYGTGNSTSELRATVRDAGGNPIEVATPVVFVILPENDLDGTCVFSNGMRRDTVMTSNGIGRVSLIAGTRTGPVLIQAYTLTEPGGEPTGVITTFSRLVIVGGPPDRIQLDFNNDAMDAGGGAWDVEVTARVSDQYGNPVQDSLPVMLSIEEDVATITSGFTEQGVAHAILTYQSTNTFDIATVHAYVRAEEIDSLGVLQRYTLPLQRGELTLQVDPSNWLFERNENDTCDIRTWAILRDGHGALINNAPIHFTSNRARFFYISRRDPSVQYRMFSPDPAIRHTGPENDGRNANEREVDDDPRGYAVVFLRGIEDDFFLDPFTLEVTVQVEAVVEGYNDVWTEPAFIQINRH